MSDCQTNHNDPNDRPSNKHITTCYAAYEEYWDRDGLVSEEQFDAMTVEEIMADLKQYGDSDSADTVGADMGR